MTKDWDFPRPRPDHRLALLGESTAPVRVLGVSRVADNRRAILVSLDREPTDEELRRMHDALRPRPKVS